MSGDSQASKNAPSGPKRDSPSLPPEIIASIFANLVARLPPRPAPDAPPPVRAPGQGPSNANTTTLARCMRASKLLAALAGPVLYRTIYVDDVRTLGPAGGDGGLLGVDTGLKKSQIMGGVAEIAPEGGAKCEGYRRGEDAEDGDDISFKKWLLGLTRDLIVDVSVEHLIHVRNEEGLGHTHHAVDTVGSSLDADGSGDPGAQGGVPGHGDLGAAVGVAGSTEVSGGGDDGVGGPTIAAEHADEGGPLDDGDRNTPAQSTQDAVQAARRFAPYLDTLTIRLAKDFAGLAAMISPTPAPASNDVNATDPLTTKPSSSALSTLKPRTLIFHGASLESSHQHDLKCVLPRFHSVVDVYFTVDPRDLASSKRTAPGPPDQQTLALTGALGVISILDDMRDAARVERLMGDGAYVSPQPLPTIVSAGPFPHWGAKSEPDAATAVPPQSSAKQERPTLTGEECDRFCRQLCSHTTDLHYEVCHRMVGAERKTINSLERLIELTDVEYAAERAFSEAFLAFSSAARTPNRAEYVSMAVGVSELFAPLSLHYSEAIHAVKRYVDTVIAAARDPAFQFGSTAVSVSSGLSRWGREWTARMTTLGLDLNDAQSAYATSARLSQEFMDYVSQRKRHVEGATDPSTPPQISSDTLLRATGVDGLYNALTRSDLASSLSAMYDAASRRTDGMALLLAEARRVHLCFASDDLRHSYDTSTMRIIGFGRAVNSDVFGDDDGFVRFIDTAMAGTSGRGRDTDTVAYVEDWTRALRASFMDHWREWARQLYDCRLRTGVAPDRILSEQVIQTAYASHVDFSTLATWLGEEAREGECDRPCSYCRRIRRTPSWRRALVEDALL